jgi:hypothetical protein
LDTSGRPGWPADETVDPSCTQLPIGRRRPQ